MAVFSSTQKTDGVRRRLEVEGDDIGRLALEVGVVAAEVMAAAVRLQTGFGPDARDPHMIYSQSRSQFATAPVGSLLQRACD